MKFVEYKKSHLYKTWKGYDSYRKCTVHIYRLEKGFYASEHEVYHFSVLGNMINYSSIDDAVIFLELENCMQYASNWVKKNVPHRKI